MKKFRIKHNIYPNGHNEYIPQVRFGLFFWTNIQKQYVKLIKDDPRYNGCYVGYYFAVEDIITDDLEEAKDIIDWLNIDKNNRIGSNYKDEIIFMRYLKKNSDMGELRYIGDYSIEDAVDKINKYNRENNNKCQTKYIY